jgi:hypothetical protein
MEHNQESSLILILEALRLEIRAGNELRKIPLPYNGTDPYWQEYDRLAKQGGAVAKAALDLAGETSYATEPHRPTASP